ncbi:MAG: hypothetical protein Q9167_005801 [Letrouitia subvulpina]
MPARILSMAYRELLVNSTPIFKDEPLRILPPIGTPWKPNEPYRRSPSVDLEWEYIRAQLERNKAYPKRSLLHIIRPSSSSSESTPLKPTPSTNAESRRSPPYTTSITGQTNSEDAPLPFLLLGQHQDNHSAKVVGQNGANGSERSLDWSTNVNANTNDTAQHSGPNVDVVVASAVERWMQGGAYEFRPQAQGNSSSAPVMGAQNGASGGVAGCGTRNYVYNDIHGYHNAINERVAMGMIKEATALQMEVEEKLMMQRQARKQGQQGQQRQQRQRYRRSW